MAIDPLPPTDPFDVDDALDLGDAPGAKPREHMPRRRWPEHRALWQAILDQKLLDWLKTPEQFDEEGFTAPTRASLERACLLVQRQLDRETEAPGRVVPNGEGGILFEWHPGPDARTIEIDDAGELEDVSYRDCRVQHRYR